MDFDETTIKIIDCPLQIGDIAIQVTTPGFTSYNTTLLTKAFQKADIVSIYPMCLKQLPMILQTGYYITQQL